MEGMAHFVCTIHGIIRIHLDNILVYVHNIMKRNVLMELLFVQYCTLSYLTYILCLYIILCIDLQTTCYVRTYIGT